MKRGSLSATNSGFSCGPFALAAITGRPASDFGRAGKGSMFSADVSAELRRIGLVVRERRGRGRLWTQLRAGERGIAFVTRHFVAFDGFMVADTHRPVPCWIHDHPAARKKVRRLLVVSSTPRPEVGK